MSNGDAKAGEKQVEEKVEIERGWRGTRLGSVAAEVSKSEKHPKPTRQQTRRKKLDRSEKIATVVVYSCGKRAKWSRTGDNMLGDHFSNLWPLRALSIREFKRVCSRTSYLR